MCRFPVQLVEAGCNLILFAILFLLYDKNKISEKNTFKVYLFSYAIIRFLSEFLRGDEYRGFVGLLSTSQFISVLIIIGLIIFESTTTIIKKRKIDN